MTKIETIVDALESVKLQNIEIYDMREKSPFYDYLVISSATNSRQLTACIPHVQKGLVEQGFGHAKVEGKDSNSWILIDCKDIIVNVFTEEERAYYNLEKMLIEIEKIRPQDAK
jgi:ribosome-associated protein